MQKERLPYVLQCISQRYSSMFFSKLVLMEDNSLSSSHQIRHYDIECESAESVFEILSIKVKTIQMHVFYLLKQTVEWRKSRGFRKSTNPCESEVCFIERRIEPRNGLKHFSSTQFLNRNKKYSQRSSNYRFSTQANQIDFIKTRREPIIPFRDVRNSTATSVYREEEKYGNKMNKRNLILKKISNLQNQLTYMIKEDQQMSFRWSTNQSEVRSRKSSQSNLIKALSMNGSNFKSPHQISIRAFLNN